MKSKFFKGIGILGVCLILGKILGAFYRIPLTAILGSEGIGLYQTVFPLYTLLLTVSSGGVSVAVAKAVASREESGEVVSVALRFFAVVGGALSLFILLFSHSIAVFQGNARAQVGYIAIAPSITFVSVVSVLRGYYQGKENMLPSALSQLIEQAVKLALGLFLSRAFISFGEEWGAFGAVLGVSLSELVSMIALLTLYLKKNKNGGVRTLRFCEFSQEITAFCKVKRNENWQIISELLKTAVPVTLGSLTLPLIAVFDSVTIVNLLSSTVGIEEATKSYGVYTGAVNTLVNLPVVTLSALSTPLLPVVVKEGRKSGGVILKTMLVSAFLGICCSLFFFFFASFPIRVLYRSLGEKSVEAIKLLKISGLSVFPLSIISVSSTALQGFNKAHIPAINLAVGGIVKSALSVLLMKSLGIYGASIGAVVCYFLTAILDAIALFRAIGKVKSEETSPKKQSAV